LCGLNLSASLSVIFKSTFSTFDRACHGCKHKHSYLLQQLLLFCLAALS